MEKNSYPADVHASDNSTEILHETNDSLEAVKHKYITPLHKYAKYAFLLIFFPTLFICFYLDRGAYQTLPQDWVLVWTRRLIEPWTHSSPLPVTGTPN